MTLDDLHNVHAGADVYVIGSGKTLEHYSPAFFNNRITIGVNQGWSHRLDTVNYMVTKYHKVAVEWRDSPRVGQLVVTRGERGHLKRFIKDDRNLVVVNHNENTVKGWKADQWPSNTDALVASHSTITTAMHLAAHLGAGNIFVVAADCGALDGAWNIGGHPTGGTPQTAVSFEAQNRIVKQVLEERYDVRVVSLLPFTTPNMDGHKFESHAGRLN